MRPSSTFLCFLCISGALGLTITPGQNRLRCYTCSFAKPCYPVAVQCSEGEACGTSTGTSDQNEIIQRKGCLPKAQCLLLGQTTYWSHSYTMRHECCEQDLCNAGTKPQGLLCFLLITMLLLAASIAWGGPFLR
ncbi:lymphocyte antigen 6G6e-like [Ochotona curzoniae]|uniref:lymphocyte antigen 6G6e-like n=1 Tax=Ochotona curzoniae TaxID=130825 RepID=UPI001B35070C|nr:lymphocyte antigen 6G6e-like [Ochotona curzoniae]